MTATQARDLDRYLTSDPRDREEPTGRVFLIAQPSVARNGHLPDLSPLSEYGEVITVMDGENASFRPGDAFTKALGRLADFDAEADYLVWAGGDTLSAVMAGSVLTQLGHRRFRWLRFERGHRRNGVRDNEHGHYSVVEVTLA